MEGIVRKTYSHNLGRDMEFKTFGNPGGRLCFAFPPQDGRWWDFENFGMVDSISKWIYSGELFLVLPDGNDWESWSDKNGDCRVRIEAQERWYNYIIDELYPMCRELSGWNGKALVTGCSLGGVHSGVFFFRRPDLFDTMISLSGTFNAQQFFGPYMDDLLYANSPVHFLPNMPADHPYIEIYRNSNIITCCGQGAWEEELLKGTRELDEILTRMGIPHFSDYWGYDVNHDWPWWQKQLPYFMENFVLNR